MCSFFLDKTNFDFLGKVSIIQEPNYLCYKIPESGKSGVIIHYLLSPFFGVST